MHLDLEQFRAAAQGVERICMEDGAVRFYRFSQEEDRVYSPSPLYPRTFATAGVKLHFKTDATRLRLEIRVAHLTYTRQFCMEVFADGVLAGQIKNYPDDFPDTGFADNSLKDGQFSGTFDLPAGISQVEVFFPWSVSTAIELLELENASVFEPVKRQKRLLVYGDSISQGTCAQTPSAAYTIPLSNWLDCELYNKAIGSEAYFPELAQVKWQRPEPEYILAAYGVNDWYTLTRQEAQDRCRRFWEAICANYPNARKIVLTPIWYKNYRQDRPFGDFAGIEEMIRQVTEAIGGIQLIRGWDFLPQQETLYSDRCVHPNDRGFARYFESLRKALENS